MNSRTGRPGTVLFSRRDHRNERYAHCECQCCNPTVDRVLLPDRELILIQLATIAGYRGAEKGASLEAVLQQVVASYRVDKL